MQCFVCRLRGHKAVDCPDKWRRYHSTVSFRLTHLGATTTHLVYLFTDSTGHSSH